MSRISKSILEKFLQTWLHYFTKNHEQSARYFSLIDISIVWNLDILSANLNFFNQNWITKRKSLEILMSWFSISIAVNQACKIELEMDMLKWDLDGGEKNEEQKEYVIFYLLRVRYRERREQLNPQIKIVQLQNHKQKFWHIDIWKPFKTGNN